MPVPSAQRSGAQSAGLVAVGIYLALTVCFAAAMGAERWGAHSPYNHYALQAEAWLSGRLDLGGPPPRYTGNNDFAVFEGRYYVSFPPVPAVLLTPVVAATGSAQAVADARMFLLLAGVGPALLFLVLERLRGTGWSPRPRRHNAALALLFGLGTVYWFTAAQGTVWFAGHVVSVAFGVAFLLFSIEARHPILSGLALALAFGTRPTWGFAVVWFAFWLWRAAVEAPGERPLGEIGGACLATLLRRGALFALPAGLVLAGLALHNWARFGDPTEFGHRHLDVVWRARIDRWGLFSPRYLGRNLAVIFAGMPLFGPRGPMINGHGLALWLTSPFFAWALWPRRTSGAYWAAAFGAALVALPNLLYHNTGWIQFGYRFSNDFAALLMVMLALGARRLSPPFWLLAAWSIAVNGFGAVTFGKAEHARFYFIDRTQRILTQPDEPLAAAFGAGQPPAR